MARQVVVELGGGVAHGVEAGPGHGGEVVVLVVQADVVGEPVQGPVVGEGLGDGDAVLRVLLGRGDGLVDVVLGDEVAGQRVQAAGEEGGEEEVEDGVERGEAVEDEVEGELDGNVDVVDLGEGDGVDGHGAQGVEEDLEGAEEGFSENRIENEGFEGGGEIGIEAIDTKGLVVGKMVWLERRQYSCHLEQLQYGKLTLNEALYGMPIGRLAKMAMSRFPMALLKARLCEIS